MPEETQVFVLPDGEMLPAVIAPMPAQLSRYVGDLPYKTWLPSTSTAEKAALVNLIEGDSLDVGDHLNEELLVCNVILKPSVFTKNGPPRWGIITVLVTTDGKAYATGSDFVVRAVMSLTEPQMFGPPPWKPPIPITVRQRSLDAGKRQFYIQVRDPSPVDVKKAGK